MSIEQISMINALLLIVVGISVASIAKSKGRKSIRWFFYGLLTYDASCFIVGVIGGILFGVSVLELELWIADNPKAFMYLGWFSTLIPVIHVLTLKEKV